MLKDLICDVNDKKNKGASFWNKLQLIEQNIESYSIHDKSQACIFLASDYLLLGEVDKAKNHAFTGKAHIIECFHKNILDSSDYLFFCNLFTECVVVLAKLSVDPIKVINENIFSEHNHIIKKAPTELFYYLVQIYNKGQNVDILISMLEVVNTKEMLEIVCNLYFCLRVCVLSFYEKLKSIDDLDGYTIYYIVFIENESLYIDECCKNIISRNNNFRDLDIIFLNSIKTEKIQIFDNIIDKIILCIGKEDFHIKFYYHLRDKFVIKHDNKPKLLQKTLKDYSIVERHIQNDYINYLLYKKEYEKILEYNISDSLKLYCCIKTNNLQGAKALITSNSFDHNKKDLFTLYMKLNDTNSALNILDTIDDPAIFNKCLKKAYKLNKLDIIKEGISIGLKLFGTKNLELIKIFISFLHIDQLNISKKDRITMYASIIKEVDLSNLSDIEQDWFYNVTYNNAIDALYIKDDVIWDLLKVCSHQIINNEIILIYIFAIKCKIGNQPSDVTLNDLYAIYKQGENKNIKLSIVFYELYDDFDVKFFLRPFSKFNDKNILKLLKINTKHIKFRIDLFIEARKRRLITSTLLNIIISGLSIYGPQALFLFIKSVDMKEFLDLNTKIIINKQIEFLRVVKNLELANQLEKLIQ